jgi:hypothetical protein
MSGFQNDQFASVFLTKVQVSEAMFSIAVYDWDSVWLS